jgi:two-component system cell cycle sensor histidine kinase/response regulator CckA
VSARPVLSRLALALAAATATLAFLTLVGWFLDVPALRAPFDPGLPMKANTAAAILLLAIGLAFSARSRSRVPLVLGAAVALLCLATGVQDVARVSFGMDEILVRDALSRTPGTLAPGRMSPVTSASLFLLAVSLGTQRLGGRRLRWFSPLLATAAALFSGASLVGLAYGADVLRSLGPFNIIAPQTSLGLLALSAGLLALRDDLPPAAYWTRGDPGAALARRLLPPALLLPPLFVWIEITGERRGAWGDQLGPALLAFFVMAVASGFVLWTASALHRAAVVAEDAEASRGALEEQRRRLFEAVSDAVILTASDRRITDVNAGFEGTFGYTRDEVIGRTSEFLYEDPQDFASITEQLARGAPPRRTDLAGRRKDGRTFPTEASFFQIRSGGILQGAGCVARDVSERKELEEQFRQAQKMEAIGRLAGGVAHDFNNILTAIIGYADLLVEQLPEGPAREDLGEIRRAADRAAGLTRQLLAFSRKQVLRPAVLDLNVIARSSEGILGRILGEDVRLVLQLGPDLPHVRADHGQIEQALMNLAVNARDAMPSGGTLTVSTSSRRVDGSFAAARPGLKVGLYASLAVSDTGTGMTPEVRARLFEPFFTTKERGKGTGLGLATTYGIVKQSDGYIGVDTAEGRGTTFEILLPAVDDALDEPVTQAPVARRGGETILLVEDDIAVRTLVRTTLASSGYAVLEAGSGEEGIAVARAHRGTLHLLLTDVVMPGMNGRELAALVVAEHPEARVMFMSGYTDDAIARHGVLEVGTDFLEKPFAPAEVAARVRAALDRA